MATKRKKPPAPPKKTAPVADEPKAEAAARETDPPTTPPPSAKSTKSSTVAPTDILKGFARSTSRVVQQAASILEEELAAGIFAAKQVEERLINVRDIRAGKPEEVMQRFRRDTHEVVDIILDVINAATKSVANLAERAVSIRGVEKPAKGVPMAAGAVTDLTIADPVKAGTSAEISMFIENGGDALTPEFSLQSSDLVSTSGHPIPAREIHFSPATLSIPPHGGMKFTVTVRVPDKTPPGTYAGLIQATSFNQLRAVLSVRVC